MLDDLEPDPDLWRKQRIEDEMGMDEKPRRFIQPDPHPEYSRLDRLDGLGKNQR